MTVGLEPRGLAVARALLSAHLPPSCKAYVFGSRADGTARRASDLDILLDDGQPIDRAILSDLRDAFDESDLPYRVDLVDRATISDEFARAIAGQLVPLDRA